MIEKILSKLPVGPKHLQQLQAWVPSLTVFGAGAATLGVYITDWKVITQFIPFYNGKIKEEEE